MQMDHSFSQNRPSLTGKGLFPQNYLTSTLSRQTTTFRFPIINLNEIILCLSELGISITEDEIQNPEKHRDSVRRVIEQLAEIFTGISREEIMQPGFSGLNTLNYPELHEDSIPILNSFRACHKLMEICGMADFSVKDFLAPTSKRLIKQLSGIINYAKFREERLGLIAELNETRENSLARLNAVKETREKLNSQLAVLRERNAQEAEVIAEIERDCREIESKMNTYNIRQAEMREESTQLKTQNNKLKDYISELTMKLEELNNMKKKISGQIVSSPEKYKKQIMDIGHTLQTEIKDAKSNEKRFKDLSEWIQSVAECQVEVGYGHNAIVELHSEVEKQKSAIVDLDSLRLEVTNKRQALQDLTQNLNHANRQAARAEEKLQSIKKQQNSKTESMRNMVEDIQKQTLEAENHRNQVHARVEKAEAELSRSEKELQLDMNIMQQERDDMVSVYKKLEGVVIDHLVKLREAIADDAADSV